MTRLGLVTAFAASFLSFAVAPAQSADVATQDDTARYLAGMSPSESSPLVALTKSRNWQDHAKAMDRAFATVEKSPLAPIREWSRANLKSPQPAMFYMFSGPDFLFADAFFPNAMTYVLAALEPAGEIPDLMKMQDRGVIYGLGHLENSMRTLLSLSFFITREMRVNIGDSALRGTIQILYIFLARSGKHIVDTSLVYINDEGGVRPEEKKSKSSAHGVKIAFAGADGRARTLYYFTTNIANEDVKHGGFLKFLDKLGPADSFHKSASYLMHSNHFSHVRDFIVSHSATVVQDDSGIPIRFFDQKKWALHPYGNYLEPLSIFPEGRQPQARELFKHAGKLDFGIGYRWRPGESNLLLAVKRAPVDAAR
ncbi:MAG TPA: hypothetical protein VFC54_09860 [Pseudolabrys sp.]|nr:hypothetical protein [Pseudolabrys sp.]